MMMYLERLCLWCCCKCTVVVVVAAAAAAAAVVVVKSSACCSWLWWCFKTQGAGVLGAEHRIEEEERGRKADVTRCLCVCVCLRVRVLCSALLLAGWFRLKAMKVEGGGWW